MNRAIVTNICIPIPCKQFTSSLKTWVKSEPTMIFGLWPEFQGHIKEHLHFRCSVYLLVERLRCSKIKVFWALHINISTNNYFWSKLTQHNAILTSFTADLWRHSTHVLSTCVEPAPGGICQGWRFCLLYVRTFGDIPQFRGHVVPPPNGARTKSRHHCSWELRDRLLSH